MTKKRSVGSKQQQVAWLPTMVLGLLWGLGLGIFAWLAAGLACQRNYTDLTCARQDWLWFPWPSRLPAQDVFIPLLFLVFSLLFAFPIFRKRKIQAKKGEHKFQSALHKILIIVAPILFLILAVAVLTVTFAAYNDPWNGNYSGLITGFGALFASVGALATVSVTYKSGEENRATQKEIEGRKQDAELIKTLNDRLHEIIPRRYGDKPSEVSPSYFQLAALYRDWETLAVTSKLVESQKESQQRNILKILFGVYEEEDGMDNSDTVKWVNRDDSEERNQEKFFRNSRGQKSVRSLNSAILDIFPAVQNEKNEGRSDGKSIQKKEGGNVIDLGYLDLRGLEFIERDLKGVDLMGAHLEGSYLLGASLEGSKLVGAHLEGASLFRASLEYAEMMGASLEDADLRGASLQGADLFFASLKGTKLELTLLEGIRFFASWECKDTPEARQRVIDQLKVAVGLPSEQELLKAERFDEDLVNQIIQAHEAYWAEKRKSQVSEGKS